MARPWGCAAWSVALVVGVSMWFLVGFFLGALAAWLAVYLFYQWQGLADLEALVQAEHDAAVTRALYEVAADRLERIREIAEE